MCSHIEPIQTKAFQILKEMLWVSEFRKVSFLFIRSNLTIFMEIPALHSVPSILRQKQMLMGWSSSFADLETKTSRKKSICCKRRSIAHCIIFLWGKRKLNNGSVWHCVWRCCLLKEAYIFICDPKTTVCVRGSIFALLSSSRSSLGNYMVLTIAM